MSKWSDRELFFLEENVGKMSIYDLMKNIDKTKAAIKQKTRHIGLSTRFLQHDKFNVNYTFFDKMTPELAHFIGFWFADGNLYGDTITININKKDIEFLKLLVHNIADKPVTTYPSRTDECVFSIRDKKLVYTLKNKYDFIPKKSLILKFPNYITNEYLKYFIQGYFEGDGWISNRDLCAGICTGSEDFANGLLLKLNEFTPKLTLNNKLYRISFKNNDSYKFLNYIYNHNDTIKMVRKYNLYLKVREKYEYKNSYLTFWSFSKKINIHNQYLYSHALLNPIDCDVIDKNGYKYYHIDKLNEWSKELRV